MNLHVLIVDDSPVMRKIVLRVLRMSGLAIDAVHEASSGEEAWEILQREQDINLGLFDVNMPGMNGEELTTRLRNTERFKELPIVIVSTEGSAERKRRFEQLGVGFLHKPFEPENLVETIAQVIGG